MKTKKLLSPVIGFGTIGLLSSVLAKLQSVLFPSSLQLFEKVDWTYYDNIQLVIKLMCVYISCIAGGTTIGLFGGKNKQQYITGISIMLVVVWLWISAIHPLWFWILLFAGIMPFVLLGGKIKRIF